MSAPWRAAISVLALLAVISCAVNLAPAEDILFAGTEDERDNVLGRLLNERGPILVFSQKSRRELEADPANTSDKWDGGSAVGPQMASPVALSSIVGAIGKTVDRIRERLSGRAEVPASVLLNDRSVSVDDLRLVGNSTSPLIVGPWSSEVGYELLYWIPFLRWASSKYDLDPERIIAVSRGGVSPWYADVAARFVDVFEFVGTDEYRDRVAERARGAGQQKQFEIGEFDQMIVDRVRASLGAHDAHVLHPSVMYNLFRRYWNEKAPVGILTSHTSYSALPDPGPMDPELPLPKEFVAVRFYFRPSFPDTPENREFASDVIRRLARRQPVVVLNTGFQVDDHEDLDLFGEGGVYPVANWMTPMNNLALQSQIISRATAFVGTYGGLSYLGPYYKVPTMTFYSESDELVPAHVDATWRLCRTMKTPLTMLHVDDAALVASTLDGFGA
ncbi:MAG TPA: hypothetical protein VFB92_02310 [Vicinamibacterales bacterium]|nr:hypothetical protein [Vicinamibacterales bacterium]